jgi:hypothetical protein
VEHPRARAAKRASDAAGEVASEVAAQIGDFRVRRPLHVERRDKTAVLVHEVDDGGVVHGVVAAFQRDLLGIDAKCLEGGVTA